MPLRRRILPPLAVVLLLGGGPTACGGSGSGSGPGRPGTAATGTTTAPPVAGFRFRAGTFLPAVLRVRAAGGRVKVLIVSEDGRPHAVQVSGRGVSARIVVGPDDAAGRVLTGLRPGRLRIVPDGATEPAVLIVG